jgi:hypothetical protein
LASVGGQNSSSAMKAIARTLLAVILVQQCRFVMSKENNKLLSSQQKDKQRSTLPINVNNKFIYQFTQERKRTLLNYAYRTRAFSKQDRKDSTNELHVSIEKRKPAISSEIRHEITHRKHRTVQTTHRSPQNTKRSLIEKNAFLSKLTKLKSCT